MVRPRFSSTCIFHDIKLDFISGEIKLSQSTAIIRHIARQHGLSGKSQAEMRRIDLVLDQSKDFFNSTFAKMCYDPDFVRANRYRFQIRYLQWNSYFRRRRKVIFSRPFRKNCKSLKSFWGQANGLQATTSVSWTLSCMTVSTGWDTSTWSLWLSAQICSPSWRGCVSILLMSLFLEKASFFVGLRSYQKLKSTSNPKGKTTTCKYLCCNTDFQNIPLILGTRRGLF